MKRNEKKQREREKKNKDVKSSKYTDTLIQDYFNSNISSKKRSEPEHSDENPLEKDSKKKKIEENTSNENPIPPLSI